MTLFGSYGRYYDLLYPDKDYDAETEFLLRLLRKHGHTWTRVLELGCGTGRHAQLLAERGCTVHGVDLSEAMLEAASRRMDELSPDVRRRLSFSQGDIRKCDIGRVFDAVVALFHVVSYQITNEDLAATFQAAARHLGQGGLFVFDYWYAPAVLTQKPEVRVKRLESGDVRLVRIAEPVLHPEESRVDVRYHVFVRDIESGQTQEFNEVHRMRYLTLAEVDLLARSAGFRVLESCEWLTGRHPGLDTWGVCSVLQK